MLSGAGEPGGAEQRAGGEPGLGRAHLHLLLRRGGARAAGRQVVPRPGRPHRALPPLGAQHARPAADPRPRAPRADKRPQHERRHGPGRARGTRGGADRAHAAARAEHVRAVHVPRGDLPAGAQRAPPHGRVR